MPPPRFLRPLRPCLLTRSSHQTRWASNGHHSWLGARDDDPQQASNLPVNTGELLSRDTETTPPTREASPSSSEQRQSQALNSTWWGSVVDHILSPYSKLSSPGLEAQTSPKIPAQTDSTASREAASRAQAQLPPGASRQRNSAGTPTTCNVCGGDFSSKNEFTRHVYEREDMPCWSAMFSNFDEAVVARQSFLRFTRIRSMKRMERTAAHQAALKLRFAPESLESGSDEVISSVPETHLLNSEHVRQEDRKHLDEPEATVSSERMVPSLKPDGQSSGDIPSASSQPQSALLTDRTCATCKQEFATPAQILGHMIYSDRCWDDTNLRTLRCRKCNLPFSTRSMARRHLESSPQCREHIRATIRPHVPSSDLQNTVITQMEAIPSENALNEHIDGKASHKTEQDRRKRRSKGQKHRKAALKDARTQNPEDKGQEKALQTRPRYADQDLNAPKLPANSLTNPNGDVMLQLHRLAEQVNHLMETLTPSPLSRPSPRSLVSSQKVKPKLAYNLFSATAEGSQLADIDADEKAAQKRTSPSKTRPMPLSLIERATSKTSIDAAQEVAEVTTKNDFSTREVNDDANAPDLPPPLKLSEPPLENRHIEDPDIPRNHFRHEAAELDELNLKEPQQTNKVIKGGTRAAESGVEEVFAEDSVPGSGQPDPIASHEMTFEGTNDQQRLSLLEELFPEANSNIQPHYSSRNPYPKLELPNSALLVRQTLSGKAKTDRERFVEAFQKRTEQLTALQLLHCSTELTDADFRHLIPKGRHIDSWNNREGELQAVIPGRDPLNLERLPFYYLVFRSPESALAYQKNASRLHKLSMLHQPNNIFSALPPPKGFVEDGEDIDAAVSSSLLKPTATQLRINIVMKPYNPALQTLIEDGGYKPIVGSHTAGEKRIWRVLMHIEGYEPSPLELHQTLAQDAYARGMQWPFHNESSAIQRLRDITDLRAKLLPVSSANPRAVNPNKHFTKDLIREDPTLDFLGHSDVGASEDGENAKEINQMLMNRLYNRWIIELEDEEAARRFARIWHRRLLPVSKSKRDWRDLEEMRMCNTEFLW